MPATSKARLIACRLPYRTLWIGLVKVLVAGSGGLEKTEIPQELSLRNYNSNSMGNPDGNALTFRWW